MKIRSGSPQKTQQNLILSFLAPPYRLAWPRSCRINYPERAMQSRLSCSLPPLQTLLPSPIICLRTLFTATCRAGPAPDRTAACQSWICSPCCKSCVYGICAFVLRCFFSVLTLYSPMEHSLGVKQIFSSSLSSCKCCIFLTYPVFLFCLPRCHMYVVYVWTGGWLISLVLVTSDNKGLLLLLNGK